MRCPSGLCRGGPSALRCAAVLTLLLRSHANLLPPACSALAIASTYGGYAPGAFSAATTATTEIDSTVARSAGTGVFSAPFGSTTVTVQDSARPNPVTLG